MSSATIQLPSLDSHLFQSFIDGASDAIVVADERGEIVAWNAAAQAIFGYRRDEALGRAVGMLVGPDAAFSDQGGFDALTAAMSDASSGSHELTCVKSNGSEFPATLALARWRAAGRRYVAGFFRDTSELKRLEEQVRQSQKMEAIGSLTSGVAHDFNNMLTIINGYSEVLLEEMNPSDLVREAVQCMRDAGQRAAALTQQLLAFGRPQHSSAVPLDLNQIVRKLRQMLRRMIGEDIELTTVLDASLDLVRADPAQIEQVVMNLVINARDAMPRGGKIGLETRRVDLAPAANGRPAPLPPGRYALLVVSDSGCGMDESVQARIFEPFFTTKEQGKGTGLGLATVFNIVKQAGGHIEVHSAPDRGTTFSVYFPRIAEAIQHSTVANQPSANQAAADRPAVDRAQPAAAGGSLQPPLAPREGDTILLVDDERGVRNLSARVLRQFGYQVLEAGGGEEALHLVEHYAGPIDLLIADVQMPDLDGPELVARIGALRPDVKVLFASGLLPADAALRCEGLDRPAPFLQKPFTPKTLTATVRSVLAGPRRKRGGNQPAEGSSAAAARL